ncbi:TetR/AcrR family transcriptional regulator [Mariniflexile litorale]|uniref:TetR/AcrR family transcriptional regulator n=1 Tax=Mariniflexile litorale TaxID=3045158 RepID=A0AAU7EJU5_9FLAO|nr:TetR/AcrR family transcriptional regulator [Mariniflexile sp. KMM 9835]MDQ8213240.1 TetR/AcrR family transcriptional regulator [Mariniflexile sp. KMM 9835]
MSSKQEVLKCSVTNFTKFGSKRFTMDELASELGISKKTIYKYFNSKEDLVVESVIFLINNFKDDINTIIASQNEPIISVILIYKKGFEYLKHFKPSFIFGLKKYYPKANTIFDDFRDSFVNTTVYNLLYEAKKSGIIKPEVNLNLFCNLYFKRFEEIAFKNNNLFETYSNQELLNHLIVYNLKGITVANYKNNYFE